MNLDMKDKILKLIEKRNDDSKKVSYAAEKELCEILTNIMVKKETIEDTCHANIMSYPDKIYSIDWYNIRNKNDVRFIDSIICNDEDFKFELKWLDIDYEKYFEELKEHHIEYLEGLIKRVEDTIVKHKKDLEYYKNLKFENIIL